MYYRIYPPHTRQVVTDRVGEAEFTPITGVMCGTGQTFSDNCSHQGIGKEVGTVES